MTSRTRGVHRVWGAVICTSQAGPYACPESPMVAEQGDYRDVPPDEGMR